MTREISANRQDEGPGLTSNKLDEPPQTKHDKQRRELQLAALEHELEHEGGQDNDGIEQVQHRVRDGTEGVVELGAEGEETERDFDEEEGGDAEGDVLEDFEPFGGLGAFGRCAVVPKEGIAKICEDADCVYRDLGIRSGK